MPRKLFSYTLTLCLFVLTQDFGSVARAQTDSDWARYVPGDAHFYSEMHNLGQAREVFRKLNIWDLIRDLGERDRPGSTTRPWSNRTQQLLGMDTDDAVNRLLSKRAGLIATDAAQWQNGVILGELESESQLSELLKKWEASPMREEGTVRCYTLRGGLRLAVQGRMIALGPTGDPDGLWGRTVLLLAGTRGPYLSGRAEFASLRSRMSQDREGLVYSWWEQNDPGSLAGCHRLMAAFDVGDKGIQAEVHGQRYQPVPDDAYEGYPLAKLPASTLAIYAGHQDFSKMFDSKYEHGQFDSRSIVELFLGLFAHGDETPVNLLSQLGPNFVLALSAQEADGVKVPVLAAICDSAKPVEHMKQLDQVIGFFGAIITAFDQTQSTTSAPVASVQTSTLEGVELHHVAIGPGLARRSKLGFLGSIEMTWAILDGRLLITSSRQFAEAIIQAGRGKSPAMDFDKTSTGKTAEFLLLRGSETADMINSWLGYIKSQQPQAQERGWWQNWARAQFEKSTELGISVQADHGRAVVLEIMPYSPAINLLNYQDIIVGVGGKPLDPVHPARDLAQRYKDRGAARELALEVLRGGKYMTIKIPVTPTDALDVSGIDPIVDLQRLHTLLARVSRLTMTRYATKPDRLDASLDIRWNIK